MKSQKLRKNIGLASAAILVLAMMPTIAAGQDLSAVKSNGDLNLRGYGSFFIPGNTHPIDTNEARGGGAGIPYPGLSMINQMYVQFMLPRNAGDQGGNQFGDHQGKDGNGKKHIPIAIVHGCCLSTKSWQTTPDGRMGWDEYFVRQGFDTYMIDQVGRGRSAFDATEYNQVRTGALTPVTALPPINIATDQFAWNVFRWGTSPCTASPCSTTDTPHPGIRFPMNTVGVGAGSNLQFYNMVVPDMNGTLSGRASPGCAGGTCTPTDPAAFFNTPAQMAELANELGGAILMGHSQSSGFPTMAALQSGSQGVKGIVQIETGCFGNLTPAEITILSRIPILIIYGDFAATSPITTSCQTEISQITAAGGDIHFAWLPNLTPGSLYSGSPGPITGNDHMMMLDNNNQQIAQIIIDWAASRGL
jgi:pimeloyl-ACP methyl ester carboxylesterase